LKIFIKLIGLFLILSFISINAQKQRFEGKITYNIIKTFWGEKKELRKYDYLISYNNFKISQQGSKDFSLHDSLQAASFYNKSKTFIQLKVENLLKDTSETSCFNAEEKELKDGLLPETKKILGYNCNKILTSYENWGTKYTVESWVISDKTAKMACQFDIIVAGTINNYYLHGYIPLLITITNDKGEETERYEATKIKEQKINKSTFNFPKGYEEETETLPDEYYDEDEY